MKKEALFEQMKGKVIVSCQAVPGEPLYVEEKSIMYLMARAAKQAGTPAIRTSSMKENGKLADIQQVGWCSATRTISLS